MFLGRFFRGVYIARNGMVFDPRWYFFHHDLSDVNVTTWRSWRKLYWHFQRKGRAKGYTPHMPFDADWYMAAYPEAAAAVSSGAAKTALSYYMLQGGAAGHNPSDLFCEESYLLTHPDVNKALDEQQFISGYHHYVLHGAKEGRLVTPPGTQPTGWQTAAP
ncbi:MAG: hypothetical protein AAFZ04_08980, partial [Pseudomonadota bacterium]